MSNLAGNQNGIFIGIGDELIAIPAGTSITIRSATADAADSKRLVLTPAGAHGSTRGAFIHLNGNEFTDYSTPGWADLEAGDTSGAKVKIDATASNGQISLNTNTKQRWYIDENGHLQQDGTNGGNVLFNRDDYGLRINTTDGSDTKRLALIPASAIGNTRGAGIFISGNEHAAPGTISLEAGNVANAKVAILTGDSKQRWYVDGSGNLQQDGTDGADLAFNKAGKTVLFPVAEPVADGSTISDATAMTGILNIVSGSDGTKGVLLPTITVGGFIYVMNNGGSALKVYPTTAAKSIAGYSAGAPASIASYALMICIQVTANAFAAFEVPAA